MSDNLGQPAPEALRALGARLDVARRRHGLTYRDLETRTGLPRSTLHYLFRSRKRVPDYYALTALVAALGESWDAEWERLWQAAAAEPADRAAPWQLPPGLAVLSGRDDALAALDALLTGPATAAVVGPGGVGKTAVAVHWAHRHRDRFADGQLYVNLRGFDAAAGPLAPAAALAGFLLALGVPPGDVPADLDARAALYRSAVAGRRLLVVLDDARDSAQVAPLLPGTPSCRSVVTSRADLSGLAVRGALRVELGTLPAAAARDLLAAHLGADRLAREPAPADQLVEHCAGLPLALAIVATRAAARPAFGLAAVAAEVATAATRLDALDAGELSTSLRAVFAASYGALVPADARVFRLAGLVGGPDVSVAAATALAGSPAAGALRRLAAVHLLTEHAPGRYRFHDLVRLFAAERAREEPDAAAGLTRLLRWYLLAADAADRAVLPHRRRVLTDAETAGAPVFASYDDALAWCDAEHANVAAAVRLAAAPDAPPEQAAAAWRLPHALFGFYQLRREWAEWFEVQGLALSCVRRVGDRAGEAWARNAVGIALTGLDRLPEATAHFEQALALRRELGDTAGAGHVLNNLGEAHRRAGRHADALACHEQDLAICRRLGDAYGEAISLNNVGGALLALGRPDEALSTQEAALRLVRSVGDRAFEAEVQHDLGDLHRAAGRTAAARAAYAAAADAATDADSLRRRAESLSSLAQLR